MKIKKILDVIVNSEIGSSLFKDKCKVISKKECVLRFWGGEKISLKINKKKKDRKSVV